MAAHKNSSRERWLKEAKKLVIKKGVEAINIDVLSSKIGVAKTSFYHFFNSKAEFLNLLFESGIKDGTDLVIKEIYSIDNKSKRIDQLMDIVIGKNLNNELFLRRLRTYGLHHKKMAQLINDTEQRRMEFFKGLLTDTGVSEEEAAEKAHLFYVYAIGLYERYYSYPNILKDKELIKRRMYKIIDIAGPD